MALWGISVQIFVNAVGLDSMQQLSYQGKNKHASVNDNF